MKITLEKLKGWKYKGEAASLHSALLPLKRRGYFFFAFFLVAFFFAILASLILKPKLILRDVSGFPKKKFTIMKDFSNYVSNEGKTNMKRSLRAGAALLSIFITLSSVGSHGLFADTKKIEKSKKSPLKEMQAKYMGVKTLTAEFTQKQINLALGTTKETFGRIFIKRPNMFRWQTTLPENEASLLVGNGKKVWFYKPPFREGENGQVLIRKAADVQSRLAIDLLAGQADIEKEFKSKDLGDGRFELKPLHPTADIEHLELFIERSTNLVYKLLLFTMTGNQTELQLKSVTLGPQLSDKMFSFTPPPKTEEIH